MFCPKDNGHQDKLIPGQLYQMERPGVKIEGGGGVAGKACAPGLPHVTERLETDNFGVLTLLHSIQNVGSTSILIPSLKVPYKD